MNMVGKKNPQPILSKPAISQTKNDKQKFSFEDGLSQTIIVPSQALRIEKLSFISI